MTTTTNNTSNLGGGRFWMLTITNSRNFSNHEIAQMDTGGGLCIGLGKDSTGYPVTMVMPCILDEQGNAANETTKNARWNPDAMWTAFDYEIQSNITGFHLISLDGKYTIALRGVQDHSDDLTNKDRADDGKIPVRLMSDVGSMGMCTYFTATVIKKYLYGNIMEAGQTDGWKDLHMGCNWDPHGSSKPLTTPKTSDPMWPLRVITMAGMDGGDIQAPAWIEIRSLPLVNNQPLNANPGTGTTAQAPFMNPQDLKPIGSSQPEQLFCPDGSGMSNGLTSQCAGTKKLDLEQIMTIMPKRYNAFMQRACDRGRWGDACTRPCWNGSQSYNCGCFPGLTPQPDGSCKLLPLQACAANPKMRGPNLSTGDCACPPGYWGPDCSNATDPGLVSGYPWLTKQNVLIGAVALGGIGMLYALTSDDDDVNALK